MITIALALLKRFWPYVLAAVLFVVALIWWNRFIGKVEQRGYDRAAVEYNIKLIAAAEAARETESQWQAKIKGAQDEAAQLRKDKEFADAANRASVKRLRDQLANISNGMSSTTLTACRARASTLAIVFEQCVQRYSDMGKYAQGQYVDSVTCHAAWPTAPAQ